jgi:hypothetical protein
VKEISKVTGKSTLEEAEKNDIVDENTREVVDEYSRKFLAFIQQEKDRARKNALNDSEKILDEAEKKGQLVYDKAIREATSEAEHIVERAKEATKQITVNTERFLKMANEVRENAQKEIENAKTELMRQSETILEFYREQEKTLTDIGEKLEKGFNASFSTLADLEQEIEQTVRTNHVVSPPQSEAPSATSTRKTNREEPESHARSTHEDTPKRQGEKTYVGTINIVVFRKNTVLSKRFREGLAKIPGFEISLVDESAKDHTKIVAYANQPLPILNVFHQMSLVRSAMADADSIRVVLQEGDTWVG